MKGPAEDKNYKKSMAEIEEARDKKEKKREKEKKNKKSGNGGFEVSGNAGEIENLFSLFSFFYFFFPLNSTFSPSSLFLSSRGALRTLIFILTREHRGHDGR